VRRHPARPRIPQMMPCGGKSQRWSPSERSIGDPHLMLEPIRLLPAVVPRALRSRHDLLLENLFLRQQLQVALRSQRRPALRAWDKLFWVSVHRFRRDWRRHLLLVRPETVIRWHRPGMAPLLALALGHSPRPTAPDSGGPRADHHYG
jgi:hypothetical protein